MHRLRGLVISHPCLLWYDNDARFVQEHCSADYSAIGFNGKSEGLPQNTPSSLHDAKVYRDWSSLDSPGKGMSYCIESRTHTICRKRHKSTPRINNSLNRDRIVPFAVEKEAGFGTSLGFSIGTAIQSKAPTQPSNGLTFLRDVLDSKDLCSKLILSVMGQG